MRMIRKQTTKMTRQSKKKILRRRLHSKLWFIIHPEFLKIDSTSGFEEFISTPKCYKGKDTHTMTIEELENAVDEIEKEKMEKLEYQKPINKLKRFLRIK